ncbi:MAG: c-type cytochrome domain-containing protein [Bacteroidia bacterium]
MKQYLGALALLFMVAACRKDKKEDIPPPPPSCQDSIGTVTYQNTIAEIMTQHCTSCHNANNASHGIRLDTYQGVKAAQERDGKLYSSMIWDGNAKKMPPNGSKLDDCTLARIKKWIDDGMPQ